MPFTTNMLRVVMSGTIAGGEIFACTLWVNAVNIGPAQSDLQSAANTVAGYVAVFSNASGMPALRTSAVRFTRLTIYRVPAGGTASSAVAYADVTDTVGTGSAQLPPQCATVVSLRTADPSRKGRGRFYLPLFGATSGSGQWTLLQVGNIATAAQGLINSINAYTPLSGGVVGGTSGYLVNKIVVDTVIDTQRRRRNKVVPVAVSTLPITLPA